MTPSPGDMREVVGVCVRFFEARHMALNSDKCASLVVKLLPAQTKLYVCSAAVILIRAAPIPRVSADNSFKYLGHHYGFVGTDPSSPDALLTTLDNLKRAPLKPQQKLLPLQDYLLPKYLFGFQNPKVTLSILSRADKAVRRTVKEFLHLPLPSPNSQRPALLQASGRWSRFTCLAVRIPDILLGRLNRLLQSADTHITWALQTEFFTKLIARLGSLSSPYGTGIQQASYWHHRLSNSASGHGLPEHSHHPAASRWVRHPPPFWKGSVYVRAIKLRTNVLPTRGGLHNVSLPMEAKSCRGGCHRIETLSHILQRWPISHHLRIACHDHAVRMMADSCTKKGWITMSSPQFVMSLAGYTSQTW